MKLDAHMHVANIAVQIIHYRISQYAPALEELKKEVASYLVSGDTMPIILRAFALDEMVRDTSYQMPKGQGRKPEMDIIMRNKSISYTAASRPAGMPLWPNKDEDGAFFTIGEAEGITEDQVSEYRKADQKRDKLLVAEWHILLDPLPDADREEILNGLEPHMRDWLYPSGSK